MATMPERISPAERIKLARILGMLGSEHDGERASAALAAERLRAKTGQSWSSLLAAESPPRLSHDVPAGDADWRRQIAFCVRHYGLLNSWQRTFLAGVREWRGVPTDKQLRKLTEITGEVRARCAR
jgi:hypothetical protein